MVLESFSEKGPGSPGGDEEEAGDAEAAGGAAGDDDGLYGVERNQAAAEQTEKDCEPMRQGTSPR